MHRAALADEQEAKKKEEVSSAVQLQKSLDNVSKSNTKVLVAACSCVYVCVCVCACVRACMRAYVRACVCVRERERNLCT